MNRNDIIRMAREAGLTVGENISGITLVGSPASVGIAHITVEEIERFAALVAAAEREKFAINGIHSCHSECQRPICVLVREAIAVEREECAALCSEVASGRDAEVIEAAIRARGQD